MWTAKVWIAAASRIFYSTGVGWGTLVAFASYNEPDHNYMRDAWLVPLINCSTSFLAGLVVFSVLGFMATEAGVEVEDLRLQGSGLAFVAYPSALSQMYGANLFSVLFFVMVICLGVDSQFAMGELHHGHAQHPSPKALWPATTRSPCSCPSTFLLPFSRCS